MPLSDLIEKHLGHHPEKGESVYISPFEITVTDTTLVDVKTVRISTRL
jgi:CBS domain containing-hemolysin-like protein